MQVSNIRGLTWEQSKSLVPTQSQTRISKYNNISVSAEHANNYTEVDLLVRTGSKKTFVVKVPGRVISNVTNTNIDPFMTTAS